MWKSNFGCRAIGKTVVARFASPIVDDQGLDGITHSLVAGIVAPGLEIITCTALGFPLPSWSAVFGARRPVAPDATKGRHAFDVPARRSAECAALRARRLRLSATSRGGR